MTTRDGNTLPADERALLERVAYHERERQAAVAALVAYRREQQRRATVAAFVEQERYEYVGGVASVGPARRRAASRTAAA